MADIITDATNILADLLGGKRADDGQNPLWGQLTPLDDMSQGSPLIEGIQPESLAPLTPNKGSPYDVSVDQTNEIIRSGKKGFQTFDINPFSLSYDNFKCTINSQVIWEMIEYEPEVDNQDPNSGTLVKISWRTVPIQVSGTWMKVEFLPSRKNYYNTVNDYAQSGIGDPKTLDYNPNQTPSNFNETNSPNQSSNSLPFSIEDRNSSRQILVQFESTDSPVLIAKHGETYKLPFNKVFVSMRQVSPRVRIIIGYNSEIVNSENERASNLNLALSPGISLWSSPSMYPVPFSMNWTSIPFAENSVGGDALDGGGATKLYKIIDQLATVTYANPPIGPFNRAKNGLAVLWITSISYSFLNSAFATRAFIIQIVVEGFNRRKSIYSKSGITGAVSEPINEDVTFSTPLRVLIAPDEKVVVQMTLGTGGNNNSTNWAWSMNGYTLGKLNRAASADSQSFPFYLNTLSENPFPDDYSPNTSNSFSEP